VWDDLGEKRKALDYYEQALPLRRAVGDRGGEATTLNNIGGAWDELGEKRKALDFYEQALSLYRDVGDRGGEAVTLNNIGFVWRQLGENKKALDFYEHWTSTSKPSRFNGRSGIAAAKRSRSITSVTSTFRKAIYRVWLIPWGRSSPFSIKSVLSLKSQVPVSI